MVGAGIVGRCSRTTGWWLDRRRTAAVDALRPGVRHSQRAYVPGRDRPLGDDGGIARGRRLLHRHRSRVAAGAADRPPHPDHWRRDRHDGGGEPSARGGRFGTAHRLGGARVRGPGRLAGLGMAARPVSALGPAAQRLHRRRRHSADHAGVVSRGDIHEGRADGPGRTRRGRGPGTLPACHCPVLPAR